MIMTGVSFSIVVDGFREVKRIFAVVSGCLTLRKKGFPSDGFAAVSRSVLFSLFFSLAVIAVVIVFFFSLSSSSPASVLFFSAHLRYLPLPLADCGGFLGVIAGNSDHFVSSSSFSSASLLLFAPLLFFPFSRLDVLLLSSSSSPRVVLLFSSSFCFVFFSLASSPPNFPSASSRRRQRLLFLSSSFVASSRFMATSMILSLVSPPFLGQQSFPRPITKRSSALQSRRRLLLYYYKGGGRDNSLHRFGRNPCSTKQREEKTFSRVAVSLFARRVVVLYSFCGSFLCVRI